MDLIDIYRTFHPKAAEYTFLSSAQETFSRIDHMLGLKQALVNLRKLKSYQASFLTNDEISNQLQEKNCKKHKHVEGKQYVTKQPMDH